MTALNFIAMMKKELKKSMEQTNTTDNASTTSSSSSSSSRHSSAIALRDAAVSSGAVQLPTQQLIDTPLPALPEWINAHLIDNGLWPCAVLPDWIASDDAERLTQWLNESPTLQWTRVARSRDVTMLGGVPLVDGMLPVALPTELAPILQRLVGVWGDAVNANHVLVNRYDPGSGILAHTDGPLYAPRVAVLSLGADATMDFGRHVDDAESGGRRVLTRDLSVTLPANSLCVFEERLYTEFLHSIRETPPPSEHTAKRISLTIRVVQRVCT